MKEITARQQKVLSIIRSFQAKQGFCPSLRDISSKMDDISVSAVQKHLDALERKGQIKRNPRISRSIVIV